MLNAEKETMRSLERTKLIPDYPSSTALTYVFPTLICARRSRSVHFQCCFLGPVSACLGPVLVPVEVRVMSQMLLVGSIASDVRIGLSGRDDGLGITGKVAFFSFTFSHSLFLELTTSYQVWSLSSLKVSCQDFRKTWVKSCQFPCSWLPWWPSPTKGFLSYLGTLGWHEPSCCHSQKLPRSQVVFWWKS